MRSYFLQSLVTLQSPTFFMNFILYWSKSFSQGPQQHCAHRQQAALSIEVFSNLESSWAVVACSSKIKRLLMHALLCTVVQNLTQSLTTMHIFSLLLNSIINILLESVNSKKLQTWYHKSYICRRRDEYREERRSKNFSFWPCAMPEKAGKMIFTISRVVFPFKCPMSTAPYHFPNGCLYIVNRENSE